MKEKVGEVFLIAKDNKPVEACTISKEIEEGIIYFSMAKNTDISAEMYPNHKLIINLSNEIEVYENDKKFITLKEGDAIITKINIPTGFRTQFDSTYIEINLGGKNIMNEKIKAGEVFKLKDLVPYQDGKVVNMDVVHNDKMKFVIMAFDEGTGLSEHQAPGEALIFALDGEGIVGYEGKEHLIKEGENFHFAKAGLHSIKATKKFKMALLLTLE